VCVCACVLGRPPARLYRVHAQRRRLDHRPEQQVAQWQAPAEARPAGAIVCTRAAAAAPHLLAGQDNQS
jgi:hypothetical protein